MITRVDAVEARRLMAEGVRVVDVLPASIYTQEHLPGAESMPLETFEPGQIESWDRSAPVVVYCFDQHCDLSGRAAARLDCLGLTGVHDLIGGRAAWTALGYPTEGSVGDRRRVADYVSPAATMPIDGVTGDIAALGQQRYPIPVVDADGRVLGAVDPMAAGLNRDTPVAELMIPAPGTIRGEMRVDDVVRQLDKDGLDHVLVTTVDGTLVGRAVVDELDA
jgi:rhodanese-related sulfurtransferase